VSAGRRGKARRLDIAAVTFDFGNTLVPVRREHLQAVVERTAREVAESLGPFGVDAFLEAWREERERQFAEDVPELREVDVEQRVTRVLARLRGMAAPSRSVRWDDVAAARHSTVAERTDVVRAYSRAFVDLVPAPPDVGPLLERLATRFRLGVLSNWPLAATIDRFVEAAAWDRHLAAVVVSQRVGTIKPGGAIFDAAARELGVPGSRILHVGDDWVADVVGAKRAGWHAAYLRDAQDGSPLPGSRPDRSVRADIVLDRLSEIEAVLPA
jgi:HAD superfamily hydrolase (TIGR01509 family)